MGTVSATYHAPEGDDPVVTTRGVRFFDGQSVDLDTDRHIELLKKLRNNQHFSIEGDLPEESEREKREEEGLRAAHRGRGSYSIMRGDVEVKQGLTKVDADAFNALSDEDKEEFIA